MKLNTMTLKQVVEHIRAEAPRDRSIDDAPLWDGRIFLETPTSEAEANDYAETHLGALITGGALSDGRDYLAAYEVNYSPAPVHIVVWP